jgi:PPOX class probable F420-dependent enzyme
MNEQIKGFLDTVEIGTLATTRDDGSVRQSVVYYVREGDTVLISTQGNRAKSRDIERAGWASLCVTGSAKPYPSVTLEGKARIVRDRIGEPTARIVERITGKPSDPVTDTDLAAVDRVIIELHAEHIYGASHLP